MKNDPSEFDSKIAKEKAIRDQLQVELNAIRAKSPNNAEDEAAQLYIADQAKQVEYRRIKLEQDALREEIAWRKGRK